MLINGKEPLNLSTLRDVLYPIDMQFVFPSGFDPITNIGGNWSLIAEDVSLPIGESVPVITKSGFIEENLNEVDTPLFWTTLDGSNMQNFYLTTQRKSGESKYGYTIGRSSNSDNYNNLLAPSNLHAELSTAENTQTVSIWKRIADVVE